MGGIQATTITVGNSNGDGAADSLTYYDLVNLSVGLTASGRQLDEAHQEGGGVRVNTALQRLENIHGLEGGREVLINVEFDQMLKIYVIKIRY